MSNLERIFWIWTFKEAYTKCLGLGLGFDFGKIDVDLDTIFNTNHRRLPEGASGESNSAQSIQTGDIEVVRVNGVPLRGFECSLFTIGIPDQWGDQTMYQGVVVRRISSLPSSTPPGPIAQPSDSPLPPSQISTRPHVSLPSRSPSRTGATNEERPWFTFFEMDDLVE